jgi:hypothetical protein
MGTTLWTNPKTGIDERIEDDNPIYGIAGISLSIAIHDDDALLDDLDGLVEYFDTLDAGVPVVGTDANGVWPTIKLYADAVVPAARIVADQHRVGAVTQDAYDALTLACKPIHDWARNRRPSPPRK